MPRRNDEFRPIFAESVGVTESVKKSFYRVYTTETEHQDVEADTAYEAMEKSNISDPFKIVHLSRNLDLIHFSNIERSASEKINDSLDETKSDETNVIAPSENEALAAIFNDPPQENEQ